MGSNGKQQRDETPLSSRSILFGQLDATLDRAADGSTARPGALVANTEARRVTEINLRLCYPALTEAEREGLARQSLIATAMTALETPKVWLAIEALAHWVTAVHGLEAFDALCEEGNGVLLMVPHIGNWELFNAYHAARGSV